MSAVAPDEPLGRRRDVLRTLKAAADPMSISAIAGALDVHPNTVRFHLERLVSDGQVEQVEPDRRRPGRPPLMFRAMPQMDRTGPRHYQLLAEILAMSLAADGDVTTRAQAGGHAWGRRLNVPVPRRRQAGAEEAIDRLVDVLDDLGFAPQRLDVDGQQQIGLRHCPFLELAETQGRVVCGIHLGLMQGVLERQGAPVTVDRLEPFAQPDLCLAHLTLRGRPPQA
ncbi:helix-turn-helix domain-containing protein [Mycolicibacterium austroafricanum]|uniref:Helix-turn-helix domain-containing protein n=1 Tax=Mycolicibacterium austroafricanum TaxID=39687 RepID=A0ABT8HPR3_MYCAO|nr:helix-turn-helix domain-containing protein [Mycolicibacterium austroafricanum]MDN4522753.1 helix-turn-helix domain-containing protein [Mycolicibacterium austroafricanum]PQP44332.1 transcriptional regulator [Mycolicibacterium austroafricanum]QRZ06899.1 helix-turn-helix domain-containing protein [Mycolicibacterium austroafricanum]QZT56982.1 helix-turn-helix domain-containing protein [Mycolicibacterium austroafricanum]QZT62796.1 helix-turn-helix domain-containing protein [Mycolicibacterium aus